MPNLKITQKETCKAIDLPTFLNNPKETVDYFNLKWYQHE